MRLYTGNRLEQLACRIADVLVEPLSSPLEKEIIVVQSKGMEHWLSMQLALKHGICANCAFPFPNRILNELFDRVLPEEKRSGVYEADAMAWKIMDALPEFVTRPGFETLAAYLQDDSKGVKLFQLSSHLAEIFNNYIIYRPDMLLAWQEGRHVMPDHLAGLEYWQSLVWRAVCTGEEQAHLAARRDRFLKALNPSTAMHLPERISLFGISYLPPFHLEVFHALSCFIPVHVFVLNPCRQYWGDIRSQSEIGMISEKSGHRPSELHLEEGNSILAAMGGVGRELFENLQSFELQETELFEDISGDTLLECIQADILDLKNPQPGRPRTVNTRDYSVQIHSCHSPMREVEVLRDNLLALLDEDPDLKPQDIVVMSPDIEIYAPYIHAVFDISRNSPAFIPFTVSDRSLQAESSLAQTLIGILELNAGRFEATKVIALLESEPVRKKFGLLENDLELILRWVQESGIRWGYDENWKRESGMLDAYENTWRFGLDRLLLGYAMPSEGTRWFGSILPYDDMEGDSSRVLGSFLTFLTTLFSRVMSFREKKTLKLWSETLTALLDEFFEADELLAPRMQSVRDVLQRLGDIQEVTATGGGIGCEVIRAYVKNALEDAQEGRAYLSGGVTFCTMLAMRSIPFKVVCMIGMNHADFPRQQRAKGFNLICR
ncbi:MAG TPA: exodeoxyribonuclease V subunit gamma, partial [Desulfomonilia bacterium]|nr:exodeoxyribonuclease V subunit gamma [Desulfomonilia bacterium]